MKKKNITVMLLAISLAFSSFSQTVSEVNAKELNENQVTADRASFDFNLIDKNFVEMEAPISEVPDTIEMWVKLDKNINKRQILFGNYVISKNCFSLEITQDNQLRYVEYGYEGTTLTSSIDLKTTGKTICTEAWTHLAVQRDKKNQTIRLFKDGEIILEKKLDGTSKNKILDTVPLESSHFIGTDARKSMFLDGEISAIQLWNVYKTADEIKADMNKEMEGNETGLAHAWVLDDTTLTYAHNVVEDMSPNELNGTSTNFDLSGGVIYTKEGTDFSKGDASAELKEKLALAPLTFEAWVNIPKTKAGERGVMIGNYFDSYYKDIPLVNFELTANGEPRLYWNIKGTTYDYVAKGINAYKGKWMHIAISYNQLTKKMICYINGEKAHESTIDFVPAELNQSLKIGGDSRAIMNLKGSMADLRVWSTTRTQEEIKAAYNREIENHTPGLIGYWKLNQKENGQYIDTSSYANHAVDYWISEDLFAKKANGYHSIVVLPDTQTLTALRPESFTKLTTWIKDNADSLGIELAVHVGDIVDSNGNQKQWDAAKASMSVLDGEVPYVFSPGNHDSAFSMQGNVPKRDSSMFNKNFPYAKYASSENFGGAFEVGKMDNTYSFFDIGGIPFMTVSLETSPRDEVVSWADDLIQKNRDKKVIISTHNYLHLDGKRTTDQTQDHHPFYDNTGDEMWNQMVKNHENIVMVVSGHIGYPDIVMTEDVGIHGNVVKQVLCDAQFADKENISKAGGDGLGMIMLLSFKEGSNDVQVNWYSTTRGQFFRVRNQFTSSMQLTDNEEDTSLVKKMLSNALAKVEAISEADMAKLAPKVQAMITKAYNEALIVMANDAATQQQCFDAWLKVANALHFADFKADKAELNTLIGICAKLKEEDYSAGFDAMKAALDEAISVYDNENALQMRIDAAYTTLLNAFNALVKKEDTAKKKLAELVALFDEIDDTKYCHNAAWEAFTSALNEAKAILADEHATAVQIHTAIIAITGAYENIRLLPDETVLGELSVFLERIDSLDLRTHSSQNVAKFMATAGKARRMVQDPNTYDPAILDEIAEISKIIEKEAIKVPENLAPERKDPANPAGPSVKDTIKTGDITNVTAILGLLMVSGAGVYIANKKRRIKK